MVKLVPSPASFLRSSSFFVWPAITIDHQFRDKMSRARLVIYSVLAWTFGAFLPTAYTALLPLLSTYTFPDGSPLARPDPPSYPSVSYYICNASAAGTFCLFLYPGVFLLWWILETPVSLSPELLVLCVHSLSLWGIFFFPHVSYETVHGSFTGLLIGSSVTYALLLCKRLRKRSQTRSPRESLSERTERWVIYALFFCQIIASSILGISRIMIAAGHDVGMVFFGGEVTVLGLVSSMVPCILTIRASLPASSQHRTNLLTISCKEEEKEAQGKHAKSKLRSTRVRKEPDEDLEEEEEKKRVVVAESTV